MTNVDASAKRVWVVREDRQLVAKQKRPAARRERFRIAFARAVR